MSPNTCMGGGNHVDCRHAMTTKTLLPILDAVKTLNDGRDTISVLAVDLEPTVMHGFANSFEIHSLHDQSKFDRFLASHSSTLSRQLQQYMRDLLGVVNDMVDSGAQVILLTNQYDGSIMLKV